MKISLFLEALSDTLIQQKQVFEETKHLTLSVYPYQVDFALNCRKKCLRTVFFFT